MKRVLIIGAGGMLGHKLYQSFSNRFETFATLRKDFNEYQSIGIFSRNSIFDNLEAENLEIINKIVQEIKPDAIVNAVGIIKQLPNSNNIIETLKINSIFPHQLSEIASANGSRLICISTDCVFSGKKGNYTEDDLPDASDLYGKSKNLGEVVNNDFLTIRTSIIGREIGSKHSLLDWFLSNEGKKVKGFKKAVFSGFPTFVLADILADIIEKFEDLNGLYHISSEPINKFDLLNIIKDKFGANIEIEAEEDFVINRSLNSSKFRKVTGFAPKSWNEMIEIMAEDNTNYEDWRK